MSTLALRFVTDAPRAFLWICLAALTLAAWAYLGLFAGSIEVLCRAGGVGTGAQAILLVFGIWLAMSLAMMLPAAFPMISTYLDIAGAAREKAVRIASPVMLVAGYITAWVGFAAAMTMVQALIGQRLGMDGTFWPGLLLIGTGAYQFSPAKHACLTKCRQPMGYFFSRWSVRPIQVFGMGMEQGLLCIGCCWALMALGLVAGFMNPVWMAGIGVVAILEKVLAQPGVITHGSGIGLIAAGAALIAIG